jgi:hypothetical protein
LKKKLSKKIEQNQICLGKLGGGGGKKFFNKGWGERLSKI